MAKDIKNEGIGLRDLLHELRMELGQTQFDGNLRPLKFEIKDIELELKFTASKTTSGEGGIKFSVLNAAGKRQVAEERVQTIKLKMGLTDEKNANPADPVKLTGIITEES